MSKWINSAAINMAWKVLIFIYRLLWLYWNNKSTAVISYSVPLLMSTSVDRVHGWNINVGEAALSLYKPKWDVITLQLFYHDICGSFVHLSHWLVSLLPLLLLGWCNSRLNYSGGDLLCIHLNCSQQTSDVLLSPAFVLSCFCGRGHYTWFSSHTWLLLFITLHA